MPNSVDLYASLVPNNSRVMCDIEQTLRRGASVPHMKYNEDQVEIHKLEVEGILATLNTPSSPVPHGTAIASVSESGTH